jgi:hypothetical protein
MVNMLASSEKSHDEKPTAENDDVPEEIDNIPDLEDKKGI